MSDNLQTASQLDLFKTGSMKKLSHELRRDRAWSALVRADLLDLFKARANEWVEPVDLMPISAKYEIGSLIGHVVYQMHQEGILKRKNVYFGSENPSDKSYLGFRPVFMLEALQ